MKNFLRKLSEYNREIELSYVDMVNKYSYEKISLQGIPFYHAVILFVAFVWGLVNIEIAAIVTSDAPIILCVLAGFGTAMLYLVIFNWVYSRLYMIMKYNVCFMNSGDATGLMHHDSIHKHMLMLNYIMMLVFVSAFPLLINIFNNSD